MAAAEIGDLPTIDGSFQKLKNFPEYAATQKFFEGMLCLGRSKPLLAIPLFQEASKDAAIRTKALTQLGNAYMRSRQRLDSIAAYESALQEDDSANEARLNLAYVLKDMISWEDSKKHLTTLAERQYRLGVVNQLLGDIHSEMGQYAEAATAYEASLAADKANPSNSSTISSLIMCRMELGNLEGIDEYLSGVDSPGVRESAKALILAAKDETESAFSALEKALLENPNDATANLTYGRLMVATNSKEKAIEALTNLQGPMGFYTRNLKLFDVIVKLATIAENQDVAASAQQKVDQLKDLESQFLSKLADVVKTREGTQSRIELGDLATETGRFPLARSVYQGAAYIDPTLEDAIETKIQAIFSSQPPMARPPRRGPPPGTIAPPDLAPEPTP